MEFFEGKYINKERGFGFVQIEGQEKLSFITFNEDDKIIIDNNDRCIFVKCNQDIRNINRVYFKLKQLPDLQCHNLCVNCVKNGNNELNFNIIDISVFEYEPEYADYYE